MPSGFPDIEGTIPLDAFLSPDKGESVSVILPLASRTS